MVYYGDYSDLFDDIGNAVSSVAGDVGGFIADNRVLSYAINPALAFNADPAVTSNPIYQIGATSAAGIFGGPLGAAGAGGFFKVYNGANNKGGGLPTVGPVTHKETTVDITAQEEAQAQKQQMQQYMLYGVGAALLLALVFA